MPLYLTRRSSLLPLLLAACGGPVRTDFAPLRYDYLEPLRLNVASIEVQSNFIPSGIAPDVSQFDPVQPVDVLKTMAQDRLKAFGAAGRAVFVIQDASLIRQGDTVTGNFAVELNIYNSANVRAAYADARASRQQVGGLGDLRGALYDLTKQLMDAMNVEFEYQVRRSLRDWLVSGDAAPAPVQQQPLGAPGSPTPSIPAQPLPPPPLAPPP
jgi:hypothetical protein